MVWLANDSGQEELFKTILTENLLHENQHLIIPSLNLKEKVTTLHFNLVIGSSRQ